MNHDPKNDPKDDPIAQLPAGIYVRVSTGPQAEHGTSLEGQEAICRAKARKLGVAEGPVYRDPGVSGTLMATRAGLQEALRDMEAGKIGTLIVADLSRYSRDREHQSAIKKRVRLTGGQLVFCDMTFEDTPEGDLAFGVLGSFAEYECQVIRKRTMRGRRNRANEGVQPCRGWSPYGYHVVTKGDILTGAYPPGTEGTYQVVEEQARWVKYMFDAYDAGESLRSLARTLDKLGAPTTGRPPIRPEYAKNATAAKDGSLQRPWSATSVRCILNNPVHKGEGVFGRVYSVTDEARATKGVAVHYLRQAPVRDWVVIPAPALVDTALWERVQEKLTRNRQELAGRNDLRYALTGILRCPRCGELMRTEGDADNHGQRGGGQQDAYTAYRCRRYAPSVSPGGQVCSRVRYPMDRTDALVARCLSEIVRRPEVVEAALRTFQQAARKRTVSTSTGAGAEQERLEAERATLDKREQAVVRAQVERLASDPDADPRFYTAIFTEIGQQRAEVTARLGQIAASTGLPTSDPLARMNPAQIAQRMATSLGLVEKVLTAPEVDVAQKNKVLRGILSEAVPHEDLNWPVGKKSTAKIRARGDGPPRGVTVTLRPMFEEATAGGNGNNFPGNDYGSNVHSFSM